MTLVMKQPGKRQRLLPALALIALGGLARTRYHAASVSVLWVGLLAAALLRDKYLHWTENGLAIVVGRSSYIAFLGFPVAVMAVMFYLGVAPAGLRKPEKNKTDPLSLIVTRGIHWSRGIPRPLYLDVYMTRRDIQTEGSWDAAGNEGSRG